MTECTTKDCSNPTSLYICNRCVEDLQAWLDKVPDIITDLDVTIAKLDKITPTNSGGGGGQKPGSKAPINLDAAQMKSNLQTIDRDAKAYAQDENAAGIAWLIEEWIKGAELLILGPIEPTPRPRDEIREELAGHVEPMTAKDCAGWLSKITGIKFTSRQIRHWVERRGLQAIETDGWPKYRPEDVLAAYERAERRAALDRV